ncbi:flagellar assembly protein FliW [Georgenia subflava]|uniref:Flagellar assembly protein FliW n=1 Tax=Georgenia subflava TaxID=1622177 RepID=A0A6N7EMU4_9MICO|nr:flagellar assembly protein FliW [Georgenia subflava]MPV38448.1 flagellar assembly protein FliW [Georgenia subflava]
MSTPTTETGTTGTELTFTTPPPGLGDLHRFVLTPLDASGQLFTLRSKESPETRLFLLDPAPFFPGYTPELDAEALAELGLDGAAPTVLVVVHPAAGEIPHTANLLAPVLVNATTGAAVQTVLDGDQWPLRAPLVAA